MPAVFDTCRANGGQIRTKRVNATEYMHICILKGKTYPGEVRTYKRLSTAKKRTKS